MNYVSHALVAARVNQEATDAFVFGSMAPDLVGMAGTKIVRGGEAEDLAAGVEIHFATDSAFDANPDFLALKAEFMPIHAEYLPRGAAKTCADPGTEMLLDGFTLQKTEAVEIFNRVIGGAAANEFPIGQVAVDGQALAALVERASQIGTPFFYQDPYIVAQRLQRRLLSRPPLRFDESLIPQVAATFELQQRALAKVANKLIESTIESLANAEDVDVGPVAAIIPDLAVNAVAVSEGQSRHEAGRKAAASALSQLGFSQPGFLIERGPRGQPIFPTGFSGSISHTGNWAISAVANHINYSSIGVDLESSRRQFKRDISRRTASDREVEEFDDYGDQAKVVVSSLKEAVYKAIHPYANRRIGFREVELHRDSTNTAEVEPVSPELREELGHRKIRTTMNNDDRWHTSICTVND